MISVKETATRLIVTGPEAETELVSEHFKYRPPDYWRSPRYQLFVETGGHRGWNGYAYPAKRQKDRSLEMGRGHKDELLTLLNSEGIELNNEKLIESPFKGLTTDDLPDDLLPGFEHQLDDDQRMCVVEMLRNAIGCVRVTVSGGKCLGKGTSVMLGSGQLVSVEGVKAGDVLMGTGGQRRIVVSTTVGRAPMFRVTQQLGDSYACNGDHILVFQRLERHGRWGNHRYEWKTYEMSVDELLTKPWRNEARGIKSAVEFPCQKVCIDPYFLGLWLGDGAIGKCMVTSGDFEVIDWLRTYAENLGMNIVSHPGHGCTDINFVSRDQKWGGNFVREALKECLLYNCEEKFIPNSFKFNSRSIRLSVLAGLIDTDGSYEEKRRFSFCSVGKRLADDVLWLARSLGLRATIHRRKTSIKSTGFQGHAWIVLIAGKLSDVPTLIARKKAADSALKHGLRTGISIEPIGVDDYYGFELDGDGRFLLGDFTVTHNTAVFFATAAMIKRRHPNARCLYLVPTERLVKQATEDGKSFLPDWSITQFGGGKKDSTGTDVVVATVATVHKRFKDLLLSGWFRTFTVLLVDEAHHAAADSWSNTISAVPAFYRFGASDGLKNERKADLELDITIRGLLGPERHVVSVAPLIITGRVAKPYIYLVDVPAWKGRYDEIPHTAEPESEAWALIDGAWKRGTYVCPAFDEDADGDPEQRLGWQRLMLDGEEVEVESRWCLLHRAYDQGIIRFKERNALICQWAKHFSDAGKATLIVATRTPHVYILQALLQKAGVEPRVLTGMNTSKERDETFEWLTSTPGAVLISPIVKEGVSLPELRAGIVADPVASPDLARQIIGRFIRKKPTGDNHAEVVMFIDRQYKSARANSARLIKELETIRGYSFYYPCQGPEVVGELFEAVSAE